jgi:hypothetical protein
MSSFHAAAFRARRVLGVLAMRLILVTLVALALLPATAAAQEPVVSTGPAQPVGTTTATLTGTVGPGGTTYRFEYGTTTAYGLSTAEQTTGDGVEPEAVSAPLQGLTPSTTYHYRLVADGVPGEDRAFTTAAPPVSPTPPQISQLRAAEKTATSALLTALIDPNRAATAYHVEWGPSTGFGNRTRDQALPAGNGGVPVSIALTGLPAHRRIYWRVVATNSAGVKFSGRTSFTTARALTGVTLGGVPSVTAWSSTVSIAGRVRGVGVNGVRVVLQQSAFPFSAGYVEVATARANRNGEFRFAPRPVFLATRFRAVTQLAPALVSQELGARVRSRVAIRSTERKRRSLRLRGAVNPGLPSGRALLQRRTRTGAWRTVARGALVPKDELRSDYVFKVRRRRSAARYRVVVAARDGGAHMRGYSRSLIVDKRRPR